MASERPSTPPSAITISKPGILPRSPLTPEQIKKIEISRLKAKALRQQLEAESRNSNPPLPTSLSRSPSNLAAGAKRAHSSISSSHIPTTLRDGRLSNNADPFNPTGGGGGGSGSARPLDDIRPARNMARYIEYDFSKMTDTKGGFLTAEDDPHNKALNAGPLDGKPAHMTLKEWERLQLLRSLRETKSGPFEPGISLHNKKAKVCRECNSLEIDYKWLDVFKCEVCNSCKEKYPEKYSLLTKTEAREDYLLTDPELKDEELLPHLVKPNPHRSTWNNMMLFLRYQVEEYAFSEKKWGSPEKLDEEFERREGGKKKRREEKFKNKLQELKKKTRVEAYRRKRQNGAGGGNFGDVVGREGKHVHDWMRAVENEEGVGIKRCADCGMEVEELEF